MSAIKASISGFCQGFSDLAGARSTAFDGLMMMGPSFCNAAVSSLGSAIRRCHPTRVNVLEVVVGSAEEEEVSGGGSSVRQGTQLI